MKTAYVIKEKNLRLAQRKTNSVQKPAQVFETWVDEPGIGLYISIENFSLENAF